LLPFITQTQDYNPQTYSPDSSQRKTACMADKQIRQIFNDKQYATHESCIADAESMSLGNSMACLSRCNVTDITATSNRNL